MNMSCIIINLGTVGKTTQMLLSELFSFYRRNGLPMVSFDSDRGTAIPLPLSVLTRNNQIDLSIEGNDVADAMRNGKYSSMNFISPSLLRTYKLTSAMGLYPFMGNLGSMVHMPAIRGAVCRLVEMASGGGEITVIRAYSSFGGTSRGAADKINEILWDISRSSGLRFQIMDIVAIPGMSTSSSNFRNVYQRNTCAYIKEVSALRTGLFQRVIYDDDGNPRGERHEFLPHTLVLVNDTQKEKGTLSFEELLRTIARYIEIITREGVSTPFLGVNSDLERHETSVPFADSFGMFSLFMPNREERVAGQLGISIEVLTRAIESRADHSALSKLLLGNIGLYSPDVEQLKLWKTIKERLYRSLGMNPIDRFRSFYPSHSNECFFHYSELAESLAPVDTDEIGTHVLEGILDHDIVDAQIKSLKKICPPGCINAVLNKALSILEKDHKDLEASVCDEDAEINLKIKAYEGNANVASKDFATGKRRRRKDALSEVKKNLLSALELRVKAACLRSFYTVLSGFIEAIGNDEIESWMEIEKQAQYMLQALLDIRAEQISSYNSLKNGHCLRGNSRRLEPLSSQPRKISDEMSDGIAQRLFTGIQSVIQNTYGKPFEVIKRELLLHIRRRMEKVFQFNDSPLTPRLVTQHDFTHSLKCAVPLLMVDMTAHTHRRAVFCLAPLECTAMMEKSIADTGIHVDREIFGRIRGVNDELTLMTYDKGVPLSSIKALQECRNQYKRDDERYKGHLEPLYELLPDPIGISHDDARRYQLMGIISGCVLKTQDGYVYLDLEGNSHTVDDNSFFSDYDRSVEIVGRFIVNLKKFGFDPALRQVENAKSMNEFQDVAPAFSSTLERYAMIYESGVS